jgi:hypothetical protein
MAKTQKALKVAYETLSQIAIGEPVSKKELNNAIEIVLGAIKEA